MSSHDDAITNAWDSGRATWPNVTLDRDRFAAHVRALGREAIEKYPADLYLAAACLAGEPVAVESFERVLLATARSAIMAINHSPPFVEEAMQRLRAHLFIGTNSGPRLTLYAGLGSLHAWVGVAAARTALMMLRSQRRAREKSIDDGGWTRALVAISTNNPELELIKRQYTEAFGQAFRDAVQMLEPRMRAVLRMSFVDAFTIDEIGDIYDVHRATAARWISRARDVLFETTRSLLTERLALSQTELDQMTALVRSQIDVSLSQLLPAPDGT